MKSELILTLIITLLLLLNATFGLKCNFLAVKLSEEENEEAQTDKEEQKAYDYECSKEDKYCVLLEGELETEPSNLTFSIRSCESDVKSFMEPISAKMDEELDYSCEEADGKKHSIGSLAYWYNCCTTDYCNGVQPAVAFSLFQLLSLIAFGIILPKIQF